ncbi:MAG: hypothetical protein Q7S22_05625 [Candidatus Micrarchaeota archaeon]|nr:hypothetical protein [Candidatus Micrarchaeota archaeon]
MRLQFSPKQMFSNSLRTVRNGYYLIDDVTHATIHKVGDDVEKASSKATKGLFVLHKERVARFMTRISPLATVATMMSKNMLNILLPVAIAMAFDTVIFSKVIRSSSEHAKRNDGTESRANYFLTLARLPFLGLGTIALLLGIREHDAINFGISIYMTAHGIAFYLASSSNGMLNKAREWLMTSSVKPTTS